jgi:hypothetical protein
MSTNKTEHYHLHQWSPSDPVSLAEVNGNFAVLDAAVAKAQAVADGAAVLPYAIGTYKGTGKTGIKIELGFQPSFVAIGYQFGPSDNTLTSESVSAFGPDGRAKVITMDDDGFTILIASQHPGINYLNYNYVYIAFR